jgi:hypothetical protein
MGKHIKAKCKICNFKTGFNYGGGKYDYKTNDPVPAYNKITNELESVNYYVEKNNPNYIFYTQIELKGNNEGKNIFRNFNLELNEVNNFCPKCKNFSLDFYIYTLY